MAAKITGAGSTLEPVSFKTRRPKGETERIPLFEVDGVEYTVPAVVPTGEALRLLLLTDGADGSWRGMVLVEALAGNEALNALLGEADMSDGDWRKLITILSEHCFGRLEQRGA